MDRDTSPPRSELENASSTFRWTKWVLRVLGSLALVWLAFCAEKETVERVANVTTVAFTVGTFYIATFEPEFLGWIIDRARRLFDLQRRRKQTHSKRKWFTFARRTAEPGSTRAAAERTKPNTHEINASGDPRVVARSEDATDNPNARSRQQLLLICGSLGALFLFAVANRSGRATSEDHLANPVPAAAEVNIVAEEDAGPTVENGSASIEADLQPMFFRIAANDRCYTIAARCTGDGERFVELGPPANNWLDVSNRDYCLIKPGQDLKLPDGWPSECVGGDAD